MGPKRDLGFDLLDTYVDVSDGGSLAPLRVADGLWDQLLSGQRKVDRLLGAVQLAADSDGWEMHPEGEELLVMTSGVLDVVLEEDGCERTVTLRAGHACLVPRGVWHRLSVRAPGLMIFMTAGRGTKHRH